MFDPSSYNTVTTFQLLLLFFVRNLRAIKPMNKKNLAISTQNGLVFIKRTDLLYCLSEGAYSHLYLQDGRKLIVSKNLKEVENILADPQFVRIHNSHLINLSHTTNFTNNGVNCVTMSNGEELAVARNRKKGFLELFAKL